MSENVYKIPLTPAVFHILLTLCSENRHGYAIMKQVEEDSQGKVKMGPGTLYGSISRMMTAGLIQESNLKSTPEETRRIYYEITDLGKTLLQLELERYSRIVNLAKKISIFS